MFFIIYIYLNKNVITNSTIYCINPCSKSFCVQKKNIYNNVLVKVKQLYISVF